MSYVGCTYVGFVFQHNILEMGIAIIFTIVYIDLVDKIKRDAFYKFPKQPDH